MKERKEEKVPIYIDSSDSSDLSLEYEPSSVTFQTATTSVPGVVNLTAADNGDNGETLPMHTIQVPSVMDLTRFLMGSYIYHINSDEGLTQKASPQPSIGRRECTKNMPNEPLRLLVQGDDVRFPENTSTGELRRSSRKRNEVYYFEGRIAVPKKQPRNACENPSKDVIPKKKYTSLRMRASNDPSVLLGQGQINPALQLAECLLKMEVKKVTFSTSLSATRRMIKQATSLTNFEFHPRFSGLKLLLFLIYTHYCNFGGYSEKIEKIMSGETVELPGLPLLKVGDLPSFLLDSSPEVNKIALEEMKVHFELLEKEENAFGSYSELPIEQIEEIAKGLIQSGKPFLWEIRIQSNGGNLEKMSSCKEELDKQGMIVPWCCQVEVLLHPFVGCFVTHCGWNSSSESLVCGVPVV
ncbi:hypothetical protein ACH5RR_031897 [Cinchona calisaya]|uniref:Uncharacterized protein n=1 Tax=Cinchona calisaya TaxID=153742 RepID=A0ABD2YKT5_9GENT